MKQKRKTIVIILLIFVSFTSGVLVSPEKQFVKSEQNEDYIFLCNPYFDGYQYPDKCNTFFINATGNYCNNKLVCENKLR